MPQVKCVSPVKLLLNLKSTPRLAYSVETHPMAREASRRKLMKSARKHMEAGIESQKVGIFVRYSLTIIPCL